MSTDRVTLEVTTRSAEQLGSRNVRRMRADGLVPGVLYGKNSGTHAFVVGERELRAALGGASGVHTVVDVVIDGASHSAVVKDFQRHPVRGTLTHIDLHEVRLDQPIQVTVQIVLVGESPGARQGGLVQPLAREVRVEALPTAVPEHLEVSIDALELGGTARLSDAIAIPGVTILDDPEIAVASCLTPRGVTAEEEAAEAAAAEAAAAEAGDESASGDDTAEE